MAQTGPPIPTPAVVTAPALDTLIRTLASHGYAVVGPTVRDGAIVYDEIAGAADLPTGWTDEQAPGRYRLARRGDAAVFGYAVGPHSWKQFLHPPRYTLWRARRAHDGFAVEDATPPAPRYAFIGVRACELAAMAVQDRVLRDGQHPDPVYRARRAQAFVVAVECGQAGGTCFCASMGTGPEVTGGYDLKLTELLDGGHRLVVQAGSAQGAEVLDALPGRPASADDLEAARAVPERTAARMGRRLDTADLPGLLRARPEHPRWDEVAERCLSCANCTNVCPTCFCSTVEDVSDLAGREAAREQRWDSCFTLDFTHLHGGSVRASTRSRYRHWLTHKLDTWHDQFGSSGCVGCGRCIAWCPVGIDLTEEVAALRTAEEPDRA